MTTPLHHRPARTPRRTPDHAPSRGTAPALLAALAALALLLTACGGGTDGGDGADHDAADVAFATQMIPHHRQAVKMAALVEDRTSDADVRALADDIAAAQEPEIETMTGWLESWGEDVPSAGDDHAGHDMSGDGMAGMPGMMSGAEMDQLEAARGAAFDRLWLTMMVEHHRGAVAMARTEVDEGRYADAVALARDIERTQQAEITRMQRLLADG